MGEEWRADSCPFEASEGGFAVIGEKWRCFAHGCHEQHTDDALGFLMLAENTDREGAQNILELTTFEPTLKKPTPPPPKWGLHRAEERPDATILITDSRAAAVKAVELLSANYCVCVWPDGRERWALEPLRGRKVLLWPCAHPEDMARLEAVIADPAGLACAGKVVEGIDLAAYSGTSDELIASAKAASRPLKVPVAQVAGGPAGNGSAGAPLLPTPPPPAAAGPSQDAPESPTAHAEPPPLMDTDFPPGASTRPPRKRRLRVAGGTDIDLPDPDAEPLPHELSEAGVAARFVALHKDMFRTVHEWAGRAGACWMAWDGTRWRREPSRVTAMQRATTLACGVKNWDAARAISEVGKVKFESRKFIGAVLDIASYAPEFVAKPEAFDADPLMLGTPAGPIDLREGKMLAHDPELYISRQTAVSPAPGPHPLFDDVIRRASGGEQDIADYLWNWLGYLLTGLTKEKAFLYLFGKTDSGKTTLANAIANILGDADSGGYAAQCDVEMFTETKMDNGNDRLAHLAGSRFAYASEMEEGKNFKSALLKLATGGDTLQGRFLYAEKFSFRATHKLWIFGNHKMHMKSSDAALLNRLHMLEYKDAFIVTQEERDNDYQDKLRAEYPAMLHSMIQAAVRYLDIGGLGRPERISLAVEEYASSEDTMGQFIEDCLIIDTAGRAAAGETYETFRKWAEKEGAFTPSSKRFSQQLVERGFGRDRSGGTRYFVGFTIKPGAVL